MRRIVLPLLVHDDWAEACTWVRGIVSTVPAPATDSLAFERAAYAQIVDLARAHGARVLVLPLGVALDPLLDPAVYLPEGTWAVPAQRHLIRSLPSLDLETYSRTYHHWRGDPPRLVDEHPNPLAHSLIAQELATWLTRAGLGAPPKPTTKR